ncbi:hypothetical protein OGAPHI_003660 [Ogataea philodendri]|uniref:Uncharacterized protein n=1 Tax=Ogataea philodendri TaxID=1378263 RepID=A0A9P8P595_9ASCO|nr:uncharacterized protein OGAPHI_003660 [Ogataea philodendri]KAH3665475.1 hypothetical protein OGAPHI_003660 [Ogataea philodendri]
MSFVIFLIWKTASLTSPVPASPLVLIMAAPSSILLRASPRSLAPHTNGTSKSFLATWYCLSATVRTSDSSIKSTPSASKSSASTVWPILTLAITGIDTASMMALIICGSDIRATPPSFLISEGTLSRAITETAPAFSAIRASSTLVTSIITPFLSIWAKPAFCWNVDLVIVQ